jgi:hypothetical protein
MDAGIVNELSGKPQINLQPCGVKVIRAFSRWFTQESNAGIFKQADSGIWNEETVCTGTIHSN